MRSTTTNRSYQLLDMFDWRELPDSMAEIEDMRTIRKSFDDELDA